MHFRPQDKQSLTNREYRLVTIIPNIEED